MRGDDDLQEGMFCYISPEKRVPADHPLRTIRKMVDEILKEMSPKFVKLYSDVGRPSIAPERLLRSLLLQFFYSVRSERMLIEQFRVTDPTCSLRQTKVWSTWRAHESDMLRPSADGQGRPLDMTLEGPMDERPLRLAILFEILRGCTEQLSYSPEMAG
jgi:hypothetical protein